MKNVLYSIGIILTTAMGTFGQISCNADFTFQTSPENDQRILFINNSSASGAVAGAHLYYFEIKYGPTVGATGGSIHTQVGDPFPDFSFDYGTTGSWNVEFIMEVVDNSTGAVVSSSSTIKTVTVTGTNKCAADYTYTTASPTSLTVQFTNTSTVNISSPFTTHCSWDFMDGNISTSANPSHTYSTRGHYPVELSVYHIENSTQDTLLWHTTTKVVSAGTIDTCNAAFSATPDPANHLKIDFSNLSYYEASIPNQYLVNYHWDFGDGNTSTAVNPSHTYAQNGNYNVELTLFTNDSLQITDTLCYSTFTSTVNVAPTTTPFCDAQYTIDTLNSGNANLYLLNTSTPAYSDPGFSTTYSWDFGDGGTSNQPFPVHTYTAPGAYTVCISITSANANGDFCTDVFCDTVGLDSQGNILFKKSTGFTLNVVDPATVGQKEYDVSDIHIFPNPAREFVNVQGLQAEVNWYIYDMSGAEVAWGRLENGQKAIPLPELTPGFYIMSLQGDSMQKNVKLEIR